MVDKNKTIKTKKQVVDMYFSGTDTERMEMWRYKNELDALDKIFVELDFEKIKQKDEWQQKCRQLNLGMFKELIAIGEANKKEVFKYITLKEIADIFINGTLKKKDLKSELILSADGCFDNLQFDTAAERLASVTKGVLEKIKGETKNEH
ncbi:MAG: hypothetical protein FWH03_06355 [Firmicutes bacterium]|nr:hypothetical protein [Bacillota bacterium]